MTHTVLGTKLLTAHTCVKMAKSIRSKRKRKLRAERREKLKPKVKAKLEEILGISDKEMIVETEGLELDKNEEKAQEEIHKNQEDKTVDADAMEGTEDVVMKSEDGTQKKPGKKALKRINKKKNLKRLMKKKRKNQKIFKW
ncbi:protein LLP homolog [Orbicella faveolata]|uniref:protein LLP homolog n=1 Tax=Orbicella faveolata TaxID=48498 RepID=UPI0009E589CC|nr:protein LLP homolog [Orbicella faveolata]